MWQGPLPNPEALEHYGRIDESFPARVIAMAERQALHRQENETRRAKAASRDSLLGIVAGLLIALAGLGVCAYLAMHGHDEVAGIIGGSTLLGMVTVFVVGKKRSQASDGAAT